MRWNNQSFSASEIAAEQQAYLVKVFGWMGSGLITTGLIATWVARNMGFINPVLFFGAIIVELFVVFRLARHVMRMSAPVAMLTFLAYSALNGFTLSGLFLIYTAQSLANTFFIASSIFIVMAVYGYTTRRDLTSMGSFLTMGLIGILIAMVVNMFIGSSSISLAVSFLGVIIFTGLTAYDVQKILQMNIIGNAGTDEDTKEAILGALILYLDFINLFIMLLRLMGDRRN
jgi:FtsH-binding integral membrane protein